MLLRFTMVCVLVSQHTPLVLCALTLYPICSLPVELSHMSIAFSRFQNQVSCVSIFKTNVLSRTIMRIKSSCPSLPRPFVGQDPPEFLKVLQPGNISGDLLLSRALPPLVQMRPILTNPNLCTKHWFLLFRLRRRWRPCLQLPYPNISWLRIPSYLPLLSVFAGRS